MNTFNDIDIDKLEVGEKLTFLYKSSAKGKGHGTKGLETVKIRIKKDVFQSSIEKIKSNYDKKRIQGEQARIDLQEKWLRLAEIKGKQTKIIKEERKTINDFIKDYKVNIKDASSEPDGKIFFKNFAIKELNIEECYETTVWYGGKSLDYRNGNERAIFISDTGYVLDDDFDSKIMDKV